MDLRRVVSISPNDGAVWIADEGTGSSGAVVKLSSEGKALQRVNLNPPPHIAAISSFDGNVWVGVDGAMLKLSAEGELLQTVTGFTVPKSVVFVPGAQDLMTRLSFLETCYGHH
jgi:streptogramin lyase